MENYRNPVSFISAWLVLCFIALAIGPIYEITSIGELLNKRFVLFTILNIIFEFMYYLPVVFFSGIAFCVDRRGFVALVIYAVLQVFMVEYRFFGFEGLNSGGITIVNNGDVTTIALIYFSFFSLVTLLVTLHVIPYPISKHQSKEH